MSRNNNNNNNNNNNKDDDDDDDGSYLKMEPRRSNCEHSASLVKNTGQIYYHKDNDLSTAFGYGFRPEDSIPKKGPGVSADVERQFATSSLLSDFTYTNWTESIMPLGDSNLAEGLSEAVVMIANVAANGTDSLKHDDLYLTIQFLATLRDDHGEIPPNVLRFIEHVDYLTRNDGTESNPNRIQSKKRRKRPPSAPDTEPDPDTQQEPPSKSNPAPAQDRAPKSEPSVQSQATFKSVPSVEQQSMQEKPPTSERKSSVSFSSVRSIPATRTAPKTTPGLKTAPTAAPPSTPASRHIKYKSSSSLASVPTQKSASSAESVRRPKPAPILKPSRTSEPTRTQKSAPKQGKPAVTLPSSASTPTTRLSQGQHTALRAVMREGRISVRTNRTTPPPPLL